MSAVKPKFAEVQTSRDGRRFVKASDVLDSTAGRAEIRRQSKTFEVLKNGNKDNGNVESNGHFDENGSSTDEVTKENKKP
jgi:hypothetical protein